MFKERMAKMPTREAIMLIIFMLQRERVSVYLRCAHVSYVHGFGCVMLTVQQQ